MDNQRAIQLLQAHIDAADMPLFSQAAAIGIRAIQRVAALEAELDTANLQADQYLRALVEIGHKLSIENAEQFHTAAYAQGRIIDAIIERRVEAEAELAEARKDEERLKKARSILFAYTDNEITAHPWWCVVRNGSFGRMVVLEGPFFSRELATQLLEARRYEYGAKAYVYCFSGHRSWHYRDLREAIGSPESVDAARAAEGGKG